MLSCKEHVCVVFVARCEECYAHTKIKQCASIVLLPCGQQLYYFKAVILKRPVLTAAEALVPAELETRFGS